MKRIRLILLACAAFMLGATSCQNQGNQPQNANPMTVTNQNQEIFPLGDRGSSDWFTGETYVQMLVDPGQIEDLYSVSSVTFRPGGRTNWHTHPVGQVLLVTEGKGWYQEKGKPAQVIEKGSVVVISKDIEHWHGASKDHQLVHIAISNIAAGNNVTWLHPVTEEEYGSVL